MKFLITGSLHSTHGPRMLISLTLVLFLLFTAAHAFREAGSTGLTPGAVSENLYGGPQTNLSFFQPPPGFLAILEDLHMDLFFFGMLGLFLGSVLYQVRVGVLLKQILIFTLFGFPLLYICSRAATYFFSAAAYAVLPAAIGTYTTSIFTMGLILYDLYRQKM